MEKEVEMLLTAGGASEAGLVEKEMEELKSKVAFSILSFTPLLLLQSSTHTPSKQFVSCVEYYCKMYPSLFPIVCPPNTWGAGVVEGWMLVLTLLRFASYFCTEQAKRDLVRY